MFNHWKEENERLRIAVKFYKAKSDYLEERIAIMNKRIKEALRT